MAEHERLNVGSEPDPALADLVEKKRGRRFESVRRGVDPDEVDDFLAAMVASIDALESKLAAGTVAAEGAPSPAEAEASDRHSERIARLVAVVERENEQVVAEAKEEAVTIVSEAADEADRLRSDARRAAERSTDEARASLTQAEAQAKEMLSTVEGRRRQVTEELTEMQERLLKIVKGLETSLGS